MEKITLKTDIEGRFNSTRIIAGYHLKFDENGLVEIEKDIAERLLEGDYDLQLHSGEVDVKKSESKGDNSAEVEELKSKLEIAESTIKDLQEEIQKLKDAADIKLMLVGKTKEELRDLCKKAGYPENEWVDIKRIAELRDYMVSQETKEE